MKKLSFILIGLFIGIGFTALAATLTYTDEGGFGSWFASSARKMHFNGIMNGYPDGSFGPSNFVNRAELAVILDQYSANIVGKELGESAPVCTTEMKKGLTVFVKAVDGHALSGVTFYFDNAREPDPNFDEQLIPGKYMGLEEGEGYYTFKVYKDGYRYHTETVKLEKDSCHVIPQTRTAILLPAV